MDYSNLRIRLLNAERLSQNDLRSGDIASTTSSEWCRLEKRSRSREEILCRNAEVYTCGRVGVW